MPLVLQKLIKRLSGDFKQVSVLYISAEASRNTTLTVCFRYDARQDYTEEPFLDQKHKLPAKKSPQTVQDPLNLDIFLLLPV